MQARLTVLSPDVAATLWKRRDGSEGKPATRTETERDRDRILYSSAFLRLGHITQVAAPEVGHIFHSRLTHSLKVAQVARRLAERLKAAELKDSPGRAVELLDVDAVEAASLAHDIGHPPFGHLAEEALQERSDGFGSFEGNPQSFRIVTRLALRSTRSPGLNLTRQTLNALIKYPWLREPENDQRAEKWAAYGSDREYYEWVRIGMPTEERSIEAQIMDWADDVTYAVHDMDDFYRAGLVPLDRLCEVPVELAEFKGYLAAKFSANPARYSDAADRLFTRLFSTNSRYSGTVEERVNLRAIGSALITRYINAVQISPGDDEDSVWFEISDQIRAEVDVLKQLTWYYVIQRPSLAIMQRGQREVIHALFAMYQQAIEDGELRLFPPAFAERITAASSQSTELRAVTDLIAGMTESSALEVYRRGKGVLSGSLLAGPGTTV